MSAAAGLTRRRALAGLLGLAGGGLLLRFGLGRRLDQEVRELLARAGFTDAAQGVGAAYLAEHPSEARAGLLRRRVFAGASAWPDAEEVHQALRAAIEIDFREGRLWEHEGWLLSVTEGRLLALSNLLTGAA